MKRCSNNFVSVVPPPLPLSKSALFTYRWIPESCSLKHEANFLWSVCVCVCVCVHARTCVHSVTQLCPTLWDSMDRSQPGFFIHGILQARILDGLPFPSSSLSVETSILSLIFKTVFFPQRRCTILGSTAIPGWCMEWTEQAPIPTPSSKNPFNFSEECSFKNNGSHHKKKEMFNYVQWWC